MKKKHARKRWFRGCKVFLRLFIRKPRFVYLGGTCPEARSVILSNHVGARAPVLYELYYGMPFRFWGTCEMTEGVRSVYRYLSGVYLTQKKHWRPFFARTIGAVICPFVFLFYRGIDLIPTYRDMRFATTLRRSLCSIEEGESIIIFPEDSSHGYEDTLTKFYTGFVALAELALKKGRDLSVHVSYYIRKSRTFVIDRARKFSDLVKQFAGDREEMARYLCDCANSLCEAG